MAISIVRSPEPFSPVLSDGLYFIVSGDTTNKFDYRYTFTVSVNGVQIYAGKTTPNPYGLGTIDVSEILKNYLNNQPVSSWSGTSIYVHETFPFSNPNIETGTGNTFVKYYVVRCGEEYSSTQFGTVTGFTGIGNNIGNPAQQNGTYKVYNGTMGSNQDSDLENFDYQTIVMDGLPDLGRFMTNAPRTTYIRERDWFTLGFTNWWISNVRVSEPYYVEYKFYDVNNNLLSTVTYDNILQNGGGPRNDCNANYLGFVFTKFVTDYNVLYVGAGPKNLASIMPANTKRYTVQLFGGYQGSVEDVSPTPTATPFPSTTPDCVCNEYTLTNNDAINEQVYSYIDCTIKTRITGSIRALQSQTICACIDSILYPAIIDVTDNGGCVLVTPTPSATPSLTPTPSVTRSQTPTPSLTPSLTSSTSPTPTPSASINLSLTPTPSQTLTPSVTPSLTRTPSVTPSLTPTLTPSTTPCTCETYQITNGSLFDVGSYEYFDCTTKVLTKKSISKNTSIQVCSCTFPTTADGFIEIIYVCNSCPCPTPSTSATPTVTRTQTPTPTPTRTLTPTPTPTRTLTPTPTPTPSSTSCACSQYSVQNNEASSTTVGYTSCTTGQATSIVISAGNTSTFCSCSLPESIPPGKNITITFLGACPPPG